MVQALINISKHANQILAIVKAKYDLRDKSEAINVITQAYEEILEPELKPEFINKLKNVQKEKSIKIKNFKEHFKLSEA